VFGPIERRRGQVPTGSAGSCTEVLIDMSNKVKDQTPMLCFVGVCWFLESMTACIFEYYENGVSYGIMCRLGD
jgi:hypothetical protein